MSVRSYNCLKRASCSTIGDIIKLIKNDESGLKKIRNLGCKNEGEILKAIKRYKEIAAEVKEVTDGRQKIEEAEVLIIRRKQMRSELGLWETDIEAFDLSRSALNSLKESGISKVKDLYATNPKNEPGWYAVRELFEKIHAG